MGHAEKAVQRSTDDVAGTQQGPGQGTQDRRPVPTKRPCGIGRKCQRNREELTLVMNLLDLETGLLDQAN